MRKTYKKKLMKKLTLQLKIFVMCNFITHYNILHDRLRCNLPVDWGVEEGFKCESLHDNSIIW